MKPTPVCSRDGWLAVLLEEQVQRLGDEGLDPGVLLGREDAELTSRLRRDFGIERDAFALRRLGCGFRVRLPSCARLMRR